MNTVTVPIEVRALHLAGEAVQTVDARDLHSFLEVRRDFSNWIRTRIAAYGFVEDRDFVCSPILASESGRGGFNRKDYGLTLDMAKELAMVERTERGKQARQYFIECERRAKAQMPGTDISAALNDPGTLRALLLGQTDRVITLERTVAELEPRAAALDRIADSTGCLCITQAAKALQMKPLMLFRWMHENGWIWRPTPGAPWQAYQSRIDRGQMVHKVATVMRSDGTYKPVERALVTSKGLARLAELVHFPLPQLSRQHHRGEHRGN